MANKNKFPAFTLAEVLITLGIIGIVAALTIPAVINSTQNQEIKTAWKENFSIINQATAQIKADNGGSLIGVFVDGTTQINLYANKLKTLNTCTSGSCSFTDSSICGTTGATLKMVNGTTLLTCADSTTMDNGSCAYNPWGLTNFGQNICAEFYIDVNGSKGPNTKGQDIFWLGIGPEKIIPAGITGMVNASFKCPSGTYCNSYNYLYQ